MNLKNKKVALIQGGENSEKEISYKSSAAVEEVLQTLPCSYVKLEADSRLPNRLISEKPDIAFIGLHGLYGEDGCVQAFCEFLKIPYTGSGVLSSAICMDKIFFKNILMNHKIPTPEFSVLKENQTPSLPYPFVLKASHGGSSLGTFFIKNESELKTCFPEAQKTGREVFIEKQISPYKELAISFFNGKILTPVEIQPKTGVYDYRSKYEKNQTEFYIPSKIDSMTLEKAMHISEKIFNLVNVRSYARIDLLIDNNNIPWFIELNTLPGLTQTSLLPQSAQHDGISFHELIKTILENASTDYNLNKI